MTDVHEMLVVTLFEKCERLALFFRRCIRVDSDVINCVGKFVVRGFSISFDDQVSTVLKISYNF